MSPNERDELVTLNDLLAALDAAASEEFVGGRLMRAGLERRRARVIQEHIVTHREPEAESLDLVLRPEERRALVDVTVLAHVLTALQDAIAGIAQSIKARPTTRGVVPIEIQEAVRLAVAFAVPGSLSLHLIPAHPAQQRPLFEDAAETLLDVSIGNLVSLLEQSAAETPDELLRELSEVGPRATTHIDALTNILMKAGTTAVLRWRSPRTVRHVVMRPDQAARLNSFLREVREEEREQVLRGRLVGCSLVRRTFELELPDGSVLTGRAEERSLSQMEELFGQECTATIAVRETRLLSGETRETFILQDLAP